MNEGFEVRWGDKSDGPMSADALRRRIESGAIPGDAEARPFGTTDWHSVADVIAGRAGQSPDSQNANSSPAEARRHGGVGGPIVGVALGGVVGYAVSYALVVDDLGRLATRLFWRGLVRGQFFEADVLFKSATFWELSIATVVGMIGGGILADRLAKPR